MTDIVWQKKLVCVDTREGRNNNKYWYCKVLSDGTMYREWGRIEDVDEPDGKKEESFSSSDMAIREAEKKYKAKKRGKKKDGVIISQYVDANIIDDGPVTKTSSAGSNNQDLQALAAAQIAAGDKTIEALVASLADANVHTITATTTMAYNKDTGLFSTPIGVVGQENIDKARKKLASLAKMVAEDQSHYKRAGELLDQYLMLVPQSFGRSTRPTVQLLLPDENAVSKQNDLLDALQGSIDILKSGKNKPKAKQKTKQEKVWEVTLRLVKDSKTINQIKALYGSTRKSMHVSSRLDVKRVFEFDHKQMSKRFDKYGKKIGNIKQLWHGTSMGNLLSIMAKGLIIPAETSSYVTGRMFGNGLYFSDQSTKSLNYAYGYWSGRYSNRCYMLVLDVAMGKEYVPNSRHDKVPGGGHVHSLNKAYPGYDSTFARGSSCVGRGESDSGVLNNEMIVYETYQCAPRFLVEFE